MLVTKFRTA